MTPADVEAGLRLCRLSHWNQVARDWQQFLELTPGGATVAIDEAGVVIGSVATVRYGAAQRAPEPISAPQVMAWIAMVLVDPDHRGRGVGTALLQQGLAQVADVTTIGLDATPLGRPLYQTLGFRADSTFTRMRREPASRGLLHDPGRGSPARVRRATPADHDAIAAIDASGTGLDRSRMLQWLQSGAPQLAWVSAGPRGIDGVVLGRTGHAAVHLGPLVASSTDVADALVRAVLSAAGEHALIIDIADDHTGWREMVEALGFRAERAFTRMYRGDWRPPADPGRLFAIIGAEFG
jgi:GNAT superfamily N-acetyltransferase